MFQNGRKEKEESEEKEEGSRMFYGVRNCSKALRKVTKVLKGFRKL